MTETEELTSILVSYKCKARETHRQGVSRVMGGTNQGNVFVVFLALREVRRACCSLLLCSEEPGEQRDSQDRAEREDPLPQLANEFRP